jgi:hypothetical protein
MDPAEIDRLYQGPLDAFTDARNALAKSSRDAGVKALQKPSLPAWAVNQLYWHHRPVVDRLVAAAEALRQQHGRALAGETAGIRDAEQAHREALREATAQARAVLVEGGHAITPATLDAVRDTLQALPSPDATGRLVRPLAPRGMEALAGMVVAGRAAPARPPAPVAVARPSHAPAAPAAVADDAAARRREARDAEKAAREREARRQEAEAALAEARAGVARADAAVERAEQDLSTRQAERHAARQALQRAQRLVEELSFGR